MLKGNIDRADLFEIHGWAIDDSRPAAPVSLLVTNNGILLGRVLANRYRTDLEEAGIGGGRHAFQFVFPTHLSPFDQHKIEVCREIDGASLAHSPVYLEPKQVFDKAAQDFLADAIARSGSARDIAPKIDFLIGQIDKLVQQHAERDGNSAEREQYRQFLRRWIREPLPNGEAESPSPPSRTTSLRGLIIDDRIPRSDRDAGSVVILSHMRSLQRLGYQLSFIPTAEFSASAVDLSALKEIGVMCVRAPYYGSVEEVLRRQAGEFDLVYVHRVSNASKYGELVSQYLPKARRVYAVADLHHLRLERQATAEDRPELAAAARRIRLAEFVAAAMSDVVVTHSSHEYAILRASVPGANVHTVLWSTAPRPTRIPFSHRHGLAFIGGYAHGPNRDAVRWLVGEIMPLVARRDPTIKCLIVGSELPSELRQICGENAIPLGHVEDLAEIFDRVRLTVAPLSYGAGLKGKVIESLGAGVPCVCTPIAAEGLALPSELLGCIGDTAETIADQICRLHTNEAANDLCRHAGLDYVKSAFSETALDAAMHALDIPVILAEKIANPNAE